MMTIRKFGIYAVAIFSIIAMVGFVLAYDAGHAPGSENQVTNAPEFPTLFLPVTLILAFLGAVVMIKITRER
jgi:hypothetical protein